MLSTYRLFGRFGFSLLLRPVIAYFFLCNPAARRASLEFLARVHRDPRGRRILSRPPGWRESFRHFLSFGEAILDKIAAWVGDISLADVVYENREVFGELYDSGRGAVLIGSHLGNMEVSRAIGALHHDLRITVLVHTKHAKNFNRLLEEVNPQSKISVLQTTEVGPDTAILLQGKIARGEFVVTVGDRTPVSQSPRVTWVPFLGSPAPFPQGSFILAGLLKCPVLLIFCVKKRGRFHIRFEPFAEHLDLPRQRRQETIDLWLSRYAARLEDQCAQNPYQWFNFFDFWTQGGTFSAPAPAPAAAATQGRMAD